MPYNCHDTIYQFLFSLCGEWSHLASHALTFVLLMRCTTCCFLVKVTNRLSLMSFLTLIYSMHACRLPLYHNMVVLLLLPEVPSQPHPLIHPPGTVITWKGMRIICASALTPLLAPTLSFQVYLTRRPVKEGTQ